MLSTAGGDLVRLRYLGRHDDEAQAHIAAETPRDTGRQAYIVAEVKYQARIWELEEEQRRRS